MPAGARELSLLGVPELHLRCHLSVLWTRGPAISNGVTSQQYVLYTKDVISFFSLQDTLFNGSTCVHGLDAGCLGTTTANTSKCH